ncbi:MAG: cyclic nucleotide-binding domain-containing protein [Thermonemataceae bacterium]
MKEALEQYIIEKVGKRPDNLSVVLDSFKEIRTKRNQVLIEVGEVCKQCFFIVEGCLKISSYNLNGEESTLQIAFEQEWRTAMYSFINQ